MNDSYSQIINSQNTSVDALVKSYLSKVYSWMALSMALTAGAAIYAMHSEEAMYWCDNNLLPLGIGTIAIICIMYFGFKAMSSMVLAVLFMVFSVLEGLSLAPLLAGYTTHSVGLTFACTAGMFGGMALFGATTKRNLGGMGRFLMMALIGLIIAGIANIFWGTSMTDMLISGIGVVVFSMFTAYDTQNLIKQGLVLEGEMRAKGAVLGAVNLYLDFINLFLYLLRFLGDRD